MPWPGGVGAGEVVERCTAGNRRFRILINGSRDAKCFGCWFLVFGSWCLVLGSWLLVASRIDGWGGWMMDGWTMDDGRLTRSATRLLKTDNCPLIADH